VDDGLDRGDAQPRPNQVLACPTHMGFHLRMRIYEFKKTVGKLLFCRTRIWIRNDSCSLLGEEQKS
jgi:hypothetical protein